MERPKFPEQSARDALVDLANSLATLAAHAALVFDSLADEATAVLQRVKVRCICGCPSSHGTLLCNGIGVEIIGVSWNVTQPFSTFFCSGISRQAAGSQFSIKADPAAGTGLILESRCDLVDSALHESNA
eukprot:SAG31_NODE_1349_length_8691_cov_6.407239_1_plen_130_part_00